MKKIAKKSSAKKAPAKKTPAKKSSAVKASFPTKSTVKKKTAAPSRQAQSTAAKPPPVTTVVANVDVGFGNTLFIRGEGPGLSWDKGVPMACISDTEWKWSTSKATEPITFKTILNDVAWDLEDDLVVEPGATITCEPRF